MFDENNTTTTRDAVDLVLGPGYAVTLATKNVGISPKILSRWKHEHLRIARQLSLAKGIKRSSNPNCAGYAKTTVDCRWSVTF